MSSVSKVRGGVAFFDSFFDHLLRWEDKDDEGAEEDAAADAEDAAAAAEDDDGDELVFTSDKYFLVCRWFVVFNIFKTCVKTIKPKW